MKSIAYSILLSIILLPLQSCDDFAKIKATEYNNMGYAYIEKQEYDKAMECCEKALKIKPDNGDTYFLIGLIHHEKEEYDLAVEYYKKAIELKPDFAVAYNNIGTVYRKKHDYSNAMEYYNKALELDPGEAKILSSIELTKKEEQKEREKEIEREREQAQQDTTTHSDTSRSKADIMQVVNANISGLRILYNNYLKKKPGFSGKVTLKFTIASKGNITNIFIVSSTTSYPEFDEVVKNEVAKWKWKAIEGSSVTPTVPFTFTE